MSRLTRRAFLLVSAAVAGPVRSGRCAPAGSAEFDVIIVGAGAAGIAAGRRLRAAGRRFVLLEGSDHVGGRCVTDTRTFGLPFDRGAHWIHTPSLNPLARLAPRTGLKIYPAPPERRLRVGSRPARPEEARGFSAALARAERAIAAAAEGPVDVPCDRALSAGSLDLGGWRPTVDFVLGPFGAAKELAEVSARDMALSAELDIDAFCREGFGALLARLAAGLPVRLATPVRRLSARGPTGVRAETARGTLSARAAIVTVSTGALAAGGLRIEPEPARHLDAAARLLPGSYDHVVLELPGNPLGLSSDELIFEKADGPRTAALLANLSGTALCQIDVAGTFGRELAAAGEAAMIGFAKEWLVRLFGSRAVQSLRRTAATAWDRDPWSRGAYSAAAPSAQPCRRILMEPLHERIWLAGEAAHETLWGTVGGAWESGERAAEAVLAALPASPERRSG